MESAARPSAPNDDHERPLAVVTHLFAEDRSGAPRWTTIEQPNTRRRRVAWAALPAVAMLGLVAAVIGSHHTAQRVRERLEHGCLDVQDCRQLALTAEKAADSCWLNCSEHGKLEDVARGKFRLALEEQARRERERQNSDYERTLAERQASETERRRDEHQLRLEEMARRHRYQLELLDAETLRLREETARAATQHVAYLRQLTREQRLRRLTTCHQSGNGCDELASLLVDSASSSEERAALIKAQERHVTRHDDPQTHSLTTKPLDTQQPSTHSAPQERQPL